MEAPFLDDVIRSIGGGPSNSMPTRMNAKLPPFAVVLLASLAVVTSALGHDLASGEEHPQYDASVKPPGADPFAVWLLAQAEDRTPASTRKQLTNRPVQAAAFEAFAPRVSVRWNERFLFIEGNGLPAHPMMIGITAWQQQVPLPQNYTATNAWQIPLVPVPAREPASVKNRFLRGAIAIAANGIPIFNPQNNRGELSAEIGELDQWGGHCGRADDYHYHAAPLHLQETLGPRLPIAFALDGYPIHGLTEPDGSVPAGLDAFNGHTTPELGYHYHASKKYPYVNGGFHGEVVERDGQVDPQPRANPVRPGLPPLRGAKITGFETKDLNSYRLTYDLNGEPRGVSYTIQADGTLQFEFQNGRDGTAKETYAPRGDGRPGPAGERRGGDRPGPPRREGAGPARRDGARADAPASAASAIGMDAMKKPSASFVLTSPEVADGGTLPLEYTGDGGGATLPLSWKGAPAGTQSYALVMDHLAPGNVVKSYWVMWDIPASTTNLPKNVRGVGQLGASFKGAPGYEAPHSQGPGAKTYVLTVYALSAPPQIAQTPREVTREVLLTTIKDRVLASASLRVVYSRGTAQENRPPP
jgi:phosphatidylethanolamine-binding protein (PEBP) family uncharacterized protein